MKAGKHLSLAVTLAILLSAIVPLLGLAVTVHVKPVEVAIVSEYSCGHASLENALNNDGAAAQIGYYGTVRYRLKAETPIPSDAILDPATLSLWIWGQGTSSDGYVLVKTSNTAGGTSCDGWGLKSIPESETRFDRPLGCCIQLPTCPSGNPIGVEELNNGDVYIEISNYWRSGEPIFLQYLEVQLSYHFPPLVLNCPPSNVQVTSGGDTSPDVTGWATANAGCSSCSNVTLTYTDEYVSADSDWLKRTWTAEDNCDHVSSCTQWIEILPDSVQVQIDIEPGSSQNSINLGSRGVIPVAILSTTDFDATQVDPETVLLAGAGVVVRGKSNKYLAHEEDVNADGLIDLVVQFETENLDPDLIQQGSACVVGTTYDGLKIEGCADVQIVPQE